MNDATHLWQEFHPLFDSDDGLLPEIDIEHVSPAGVGALWSYLHQMAAGYAENTQFWHTDTEQSLPLDAVENAALLVVAGEAESFHSVLQGISCFNVMIPDLGVFVSRDAIVLDYRAGTDWNADNLIALFELLYQIRRIEPNSVISLSKNFFVPEWRARFNIAFAMYINKYE